MQRLDSGSIKTRLKFYSLILCKVGLGLVVAGGLGSKMKVDVLAGGPGDLDIDFGINGMVTTDVNNSSEIGDAGAIQPDGKILVAGQSSQGLSSDFAVARYLATGSLDITFGGDGKVTTNFDKLDRPYDIAVQPDSKVVVAGVRSDGSDVSFAVVRYNYDGSLDNSFDSDGKVITDFYGNVDTGRAIAIQPDAKIIIAGYSSGTGTSNTDFALVRYNENGSVDTVFGNYGKTITDFGGLGDFAYDLTIQPDGKIVVVGESRSNSSSVFSVARYNVNGSLDTTFNGTGKSSLAHL